MKLFKSNATQEPVVQATTPVKPPVLEGWSEKELVAVYNAAPVRHLKKGESLLADLEFTESFFVLLDGSLQVVVKWDNHLGRPGVIRRGDCIAPLPKSPGLLYCAEATEPCTVIELTPKVLAYLPANTQLSIYKVAVGSTSRINAYIRAVNGEVTAKNAHLVSYIEARSAASRAASGSEQVQKFLKSIPALPTNAMDIAMKVLDETTSVQEVVEAIKRDPAAATAIMRTVNSAQYSFGNKIETFYHACIILGFNNIYNLLMTEAVRSALPAREAVQRIHDHSAVIATLCHEISMASKNMQPQIATTVGLLHDVGKAVQLMMKDTHWLADDHVDLLDSAKIGADLLKGWSLPDRVCRIVENQHRPEFTPPDALPGEYRREAGILYLAHVIESILLGSRLETESVIYAKDYMAVLGIASGTPQDFLKDTVMPSLTRNSRRLPQDLQIILGLPADLSNK